MKNLLMSSVAFAPDGEGSGSGSGDAGGDSSTILYGEAGEGAGDNQGAGGDNKADGAGTEWQEYVVDSTKSEEENAALKAEHDKTKPAEGEKQGEKSPEDTVPEDGKYDIKLADGVTIDEALLEKAAPVMKELGLTNGQASKLAGVLAEQRKAEFDALNERNQKIVADWQTEIKSDKDFGGDKLKDSTNTANRVIATFGDDAFKRDLVDLGLGNHPGLFRLLARVGNALSDDKPVASETPAASVPKDHAEILYGR